MKKAMIAIAFSGLLMTACGSGAEKLNEAGNTAFAEQDYAAAAEKYQEAADADAELAAPLYNTAGALYRQEALIRCRLHYRSPWRMPTKP